jgi:hypothetical protein
VVGVVGVVGVVVPGVVVPGVVAVDGRDEVLLGQAAKSATAMAIIAKVPTKVLKPTVCCFICNIVSYYIQLSKLCALSIYKPKIYAFFSMEALTLKQKSSILVA